jgi:hypothetical protein
VKYQLDYDKETGNHFKGYFYCNEREQKEFVHTFKAANFDRVWRELKEQSIEFEIVRQNRLVFFYKTALDS